MSNENEYVTQVAHVVKKNNHLYYSNSNGLFKSTDNGENWEQIKVCENCIGVSTISSNNAGVLYAGGYRSLNRSSDDGQNWTKIETYPFFNTSNIFINDNGWIYVGGRESLYLTKDEGLSWKNLLPPTGFEIVINKTFVDKDNDVFLLLTNYPLIRVCCLSQALINLPINL